MSGKNLIKFLIVLLSVLAAVVVVWLLLCCKAAGNAIIPEEVRKEPRRMFVVVAGDLMQHLPQVNAARRVDGGFDYSGCFVHVAPLFLSADAVIVNLETTLADEPPYSGYPAFGSPSQLAFDMYDAGMRYAVTANNHTLDKGAKGVEGTISALDRAKIRHTGVFADSLRYAQENPLMIESGGIRFALLNYTYGTNGARVPEGITINLIDTLQIKRDLAKADSLKPDFKMVYLHWGHEYHTQESPEQRTLAGWLREHGVEFVIGSHPHVAQPLHMIRDTAGNFEGCIVYSLGNFVSNQSRRNTDGGLVVTFDIRIEDGAGMKVDGKYMPVWTYRYYADGKPNYSIIPSVYADSLLAGDEAAKAGYYSFRKNLNKIIAADNFGFEELTTFPDEISDL